MTKIKRINKKTKRRKRFLFRKKKNTKKIYRKLKKNFTFRKRKYVKKIRRKGKKTRKRIQRGGIIRRGVAGPGGVIASANVAGGNRNTAPPVPHWAMPAFFENFVTAGVPQYYSTSIAANYNNYFAGGPQQLYATGLPDQCATGPNAILQGGVLGCHPDSRLGRTMAYFMYIKGVKNWISLQACGHANAGANLIHHFPPCLGNPNAPVGSTAFREATVEDNTWFRLARKYDNPGNTAAERAAALLVNRVDHIFIQDMTVGTMEAWNELGEYGNIFDDTNATVIHCYAGWGRTGAAMFFYILRNYFLQPAMLPGFHRPWLGCLSASNNNGLVMYDTLRMLMNKSLDWHDLFLDPNLHAFQGTPAAPLYDLNLHALQNYPGGKINAVINTLHRVTRAEPIDTHSAVVGGVYTYGPPAGRSVSAPATFPVGHAHQGQPNPDAGSWEHFINGYNRTSDMVHEVFNVDQSRAIFPWAGNFLSNIFIGRINTMLIQIWAYLYLQNRPGSIAPAARLPGWDYIYLYILPTCPVGAPNTWGGVGGVVAAVAANNISYPPSTPLAPYGRTNPYKILGRNEVLPAYGGVGQPPTLAAAGVQRRRRGGVVCHFRYICQIS